MSLENDVKQRVLNLKNISSKNFLLVKLPHIPNHNTLNSAFLICLEKAEKGEEITQLVYDQVVEAINDLSQIIKTQLRPRPKLKPIEPKNQQKHYSLNYLQFNRFKPYEVVLITRENYSLGQSFHALSDYLDQLNT